VAAVKPCIDCGINTCQFDGIGEYYMVDHELWASVVFPPRSSTHRIFLCIGCIEARLGRLLTPCDFLPAPVNWKPGEYRSPRLRDRLGFD
jgi:hypothetical protein